MGTTLIIVELVIIGFQVMVWVTLLLGHDWLPFAKLKDWIPVVGVLVLALAYTLGLVFDRFLGFLSSIVQKFIHKILHKPDRAKERFCIRPKKWFYIMLNYPEANKELENIKRRIHLLRATFFNTFLIVIIGFLKCRSWLFLGLLILSVLAAATWRWDSKEFDKALDGLYKVAKTRERQKSESRG